MVIRKRFIFSIYVISFIALLGSCGKTRMPFEVLYLDLDGTALNSQSRVNETVKIGVDRFKACGGRVGIATGRTLEQAQEAIGVLEPDLPAVLFNGCVIFDTRTGQAKVVAALSDEVVNQVKPQLLAETAIAGFVLHYACSSVAFGNPEVMHEIARHSSITLVDQPTPDETEVIKILVFCLSDEADNVSDRIMEKLSPEARTVISSPQTVEILPAGANKAKAIEQALTDYQLELGDVVAFGDSGNDVEMLGSVGFGVAMENARNETKVAADTVIGHHDTDAIEKFITGALLTEKCLQVDR